MRTVKVLHTLHGHNGSTLVRESLKNERRLLISDNQLAQQLRDFTSLSKAWAASLIPSERVR